MVDPLRLLERADKHYLGSGAGIIFAPRYPRWLQHPGFWDEVDVYSYPLAPLFTVTFLSENGPAAAPLSARQASRRWSPAELIAGYELGPDLEGHEHRSVRPGGCFLSEWALTARRGGPWTLLAVIWTVQDTAGLELSTVEAAPGSVRFRRDLRDRHGKRLEVDVSLEAPGDAVAGSARLSEAAPLEPRWELSPFPEKWTECVDTGVHVDGVSPAGVLYAAAVSRVTVPAAGQAPVTLRAQIRPRGVEIVSSPGGTGGPVPAPPPGQDLPSEPGLPREAGLPPQPGLPAESVAASLSDPGSASRADWSAFFAGVPELVCSDEYIERYWYYRWYGLRLCGHEGGIGNYEYPGCCEGTGYFHLPIAYSAQCHARELRWLADPGRARGVLLNFLAHQQGNGRLHGRIYLNHLEHTDFYFADWGDAVLAVDTVHPDLEFLRAAYRALTRYAEWLERERDAEGSGLIDVIDHYETGQEYMSRYLAVSPDADAESWGARIRLKGVDATVYAYRLQRALAVIAGRLHEFGEAGRWIAAADRTAAALLDVMWDAEAGMFSDVDPRDMRRTGVKTAVCFYPYFTDLVGPEHVDGLRRHLLDPGEFWTEYPVPTTSADDPYYSPDAEWKGKRHNCPWNGRVWPMANSHVAEALARTAIEHDAGLRPTAAEFIGKFIRMMFHDGDPARPNCYEHYNPDSGRPSLYRGYDDYQHSWVNDLIVKYVAGFRAAPGDSFVIDPLPFHIESLRLSRLPFRGRLIDVEVAGGRFEARVDGVSVGESRIGEPIEARL